MDLLQPMAAILIVSFFGWITPGPNMFAVMSASLTHGRMHGLATGAGLALAATIWAACALAGAAVVFDLFPRLVVALKLAGAAYLIWLGLRAFASLRNCQQDAGFSQMSPPTLPQALRSGFLISMTNPKAALFYGAILTSVIPPDAPQWFLVSLVLFCGLLAFGLHAVTATVFSTRPALSLFQSASRLITALFGTVFITLGGAIAVSALRRS